MATLAFGLAVLFRLYQEVWSNALVVAGFYGAEVCIEITVHSTHSISVTASGQTNMAQPMLCSIWPIQVSMTAC